MAGSTPDTIHVMIPDCLIPPVGEEVHIDLRHVVTLQLGPVTDMGDDLPPPGLAGTLCSEPLAPTLGLQRKDYWQKINPLLVEWKNVNDSKCPKCDIRVNMARHLRLCHTTYVCFWRCPVSTCPLWFTSELNGKDHIERIHRFREGRGCSFYECLRTYGLEWFSSRPFFDQHIITQSPEFAPLRRFFIAAVNQLQIVFDDLPVPSRQPSQSAATPLLETMRVAINTFRGLHGAWFAAREQSRCHRIGQHITVCIFSR